MQAKTSQKILDYIKQNKQASGKELSDFFGISSRAVRKQLKNLLDKKLLKKIGKPPKVFYLINEERQEKEYDSVDAPTKKIIDNNYLIISTAGEKKEGWSGFVYWCKKNNLDTKKTAQDYIKTLNKYQKFKKNNLINGMDKLKQTFDDAYLDKLFYLDFYSIERFGKTKLGQMLLYGKQSGNKMLIKKIIKEINPRIQQIIKDYKIDAVGFIPWTVKREVQLMRELKKGLNIALKNISIEKVKTEVIVPQKTLPKLRDRVENAKNTIVVTETGQYNNVLLIDDAVGSGATLNEIAKQIKFKKRAKNVFGLAITGSFKGFDVISEV